MSLFFFIGTYYYKLTYFGIDDINKKFHELVLNLKFLSH